MEKGLCPLRQWSKYFANSNYSRRRESKKSKGESEATRERERDALEIAGALNVWRLQTGARARHRADSRIASLCSAPLRYATLRFLGFQLRLLYSKFIGSRILSVRRRDETQISFGNPARARACVCVCVHGQGNNVFSFDPAAERAEKCSILQKNRARLPRYLYFSVNLLAPFTGSSLLRRKYICVRTSFSRSRVFMFSYASGTRIQDWLLFRQ